MRNFNPMPAFVLAMLLTPCLASVGKAQQQINTQVNNPNPPQNPNNPATIRYTPQFEVMPSERLFAFQRSGMTPSEYRMNLASIGPLAPQGAVDYISPQSQLQQELRLPPPLLFNPAYVPPLPANINAPEPPPPLPSVETFNLNRSAASAPYSIDPGPMDRLIPGTIAPIRREESTVTYRLPGRSIAGPEPVPSGLARPQHDARQASPSTRPSAPLSAGELPK